MPAPFLKPEFDAVQRQITETLSAAGETYGKEHYTYMAQELIRMFDIRRRPLALDWSYIKEPAPTCDKCSTPSMYLFTEKRYCSYHHDELQKEKK